MPAVIALALIAIAVLTVLSVTAHLLFSPWLLLVVIAIAAWAMLRRRRSHR